MFAEITNYTSAATLTNLAGNAAGPIIGKVNTALNDAQKDLGTLITLLQTNSSGGFDGVSTVISKLISDQATGAGNIASQFVGPVVNALASNANGEINSILTNTLDLGPTLIQIQSDLIDASNKIAQAQSSLTNGLGQLNQALGQIVGDANGIQQFALAFAVDMTNYLAGVITPAGDFFTANAASARTAIQNQMLNGFVSSSLATDYQQTLKQFLFDDNALVDQLMDSFFDQIDEAIREGLSTLIDDAIDSSSVLGDLAAVKNLASGSFLTAKIKGSPTFNGDSLRKIHLDANVQLSLPKPMTFQAYMEIKELDSQSGPVDCIPTGDSATEITLGTKNVKLDWAAINPSGTPLILKTLEARWTLQNGNVIGIGGELNITGQVGFHGFSLNEIGADLAFGATENYIAAKAAGTIAILGIPVNVNAGIFAGQACSLEPLTFIDPNAEKVLDNASGFAGLYCQYGGSLSLSQILFGTSNCFLDVDASVNAGEYFQFSPLSMGGTYSYGLSLSLLCLISGNADLTVFGGISTPNALDIGGYDLSFGGSAQICGHLGPCPFCVSGCKGIELTGSLSAGGIKYNISY